MKDRTQLDSLPLVNVYRRQGNRKRRCLTLTICSLVCSFSCLLPTITFLYLLIDTDSWHTLIGHCYRWLEHNHWDAQVTRVAWSIIDLIDDNHSVILMVLGSLSSTNIILSFMVMASSVTDRRALMVPWLMFNTLTIIIITLVFIVWTFLSFFISLLLAIIFPVIAGTILGVWILIWKTIYAAHANFYHVTGSQERRCKSEHRHRVSHQMSVQRKL